MEHANQIGFLIGIYIKTLASKCCIKDIKSKLEIAKKLIDVKKLCAREKGKWSKVMMIYATKNNADCINEEFSKLKANGTSMHHLRTLH